MRSPSLRTVEGLKETAASSPSVSGPANVLHYKLASSRKEKINLKVAQQCDPKCCPTENYPSHAKSHANSLLKSLNTLKKEKGQCDGP